MPAHDFDYRKRNTAWPRASRIAREHGFGRRSQLIGAHDELRSLKSSEPAVITPMDADRSQGSDVIFAPESRITRKAYELAGEKPTFIDLTYALEDSPKRDFELPWWIRNEGSAAFTCSRIPPPQRSR